MENEGNTATRLGFRVRYGDQVYEPAPWTEPWPLLERPLFQRISPDGSFGEKIKLRIEELVQQMRVAVAELGELDTSEKIERASQIRSRFEHEIQRLREELADLGDHPDQGTTILPRDFPPAPWLGHVIEVPGLGIVQFNVQLRRPAHPAEDGVIAWPDNYYPWDALAPGQSARVTVVVFTHPDIQLGLHPFTLPVDGHDLIPEEPTGSEPSPDDPNALNGTAP